MTSTAGTDSTRSHRFGLVVVNYNGAETLLPALRSALRAGVEEHHLVLVDNGSVDTSVEQAHAALPNMRVVRNGCNAGFAAAVNRGLRLLQNEFVVLLNNDAEMDLDALKGFAAAFDENPRVAIAGGQLRYPNGRLQSSFAALPTVWEEVVPMNFLKWAQPERYLRVTDGTEAREVETVFGACLAVRAAAIADAGPLDERFFFYFEEVEWCERMRRHGWRVQYQPAARATHLFGHTAKRFRGEARIELQRSKLLYFRLCSTPAAARTVAAVLLFRSAVNALSGLVACVGTLFLQRRTRERARTYRTVFLWHLLGRPASWGLPDKCRSSPRKNLQR